MGWLGNLSGWHFLIILLVILLVFGATRLPALAKSLGQSAKILRNELKSDDPPAPTVAEPQPPEQSAPAAPQLNTTSAQPVSEQPSASDKR